jgi:hypothetical protein
MTWETIIATTPAVLALGLYLTGIVEEIHSLRAIAEARRIIAENNSNQSKFQYELNNCPEKHQKSSTCCGQSGAREYNTDYRVYQCQECGTDCCAGCNAVWEECK